MMPVAFRDFVVAWWRRPLTKATLVSVASLGAIVVMRHGLVNLAVAVGVALVIGLPLGYRRFRQTAASDSARSDADTAVRHPVAMPERMLTERAAFRAARYFIEQFNTRAKSEALELWVGWMTEGTWPSDPLETADPAQWHDWVACVDRVASERE